MSQNQNPPAQEAVSAMPPPDARLLAAMYGVQEKKKEGLFKKYWPLIRRSRKLILSVFVVVALLSGWRIFTLPDCTKPKC